MEIEDRVYGKHCIEEEVLMNLINSKALDRLKDISQLGMPDEYYFMKGYNRYEHSLGVLILLKKLGASLEEQVAGLLHDVSHTPFSHVIDWVIGDPNKEDYQDENHKAFIEQTEIPPILRENFLDVDYILNYKNFKLLERDAPSLCADRIDYTLRELAILDKEDIAKEFADDLIVKNNHIVFNTKEIAKSFGKEYTLRQNENWGGNQARVRYFILANVLRRGFEMNFINLDDLKTSETPLLNKLYASQDEYIIKNLSLLKKGFKIQEDVKGIELKKKFRYIDPEVSLNGSYKRLSEISYEYKKIIDKEKENSNLIKKVIIIPT